MRGSISWHVSRNDFSLIILQGGFTSQQAICLAYVYYYPRLPLSNCETSTEFQSFFQALGVGVGDIE